MLHLTWFFRMLRDVAVYGWTNRSFGLAAMILVLIGIGLILMTMVFGYLYLLLLWQP